jgi:hypothetical protein
VQELQIGGTSDTPINRKSASSAIDLIRLPYATETGCSAVGRAIRTIAVTSTICRKRLQKILRQAWHGCNIPPGNEQICIFCHSTAENDAVTGSVAHIVKL